MIKARKMKGVLFVKSNIMHIDALCNKGSILLKTPKCRSLVQHTNPTTASFSAQNTCSDIKQQIKGSPNYNVWHTAKEFNCWRIIDYRYTKGNKMWWVSVRSPNDHQCNRTYHMNYSNLQQGQAQAIIRNKVMPLVCWNKHLKEKEDK